MTAGMKIRLAAFVLAITLLVSLIVWVALTSARLIEDARSRMTLAQSESWRIAMRFQQGLAGLNEQLLKFALHHDTNEWIRFEKEWNALNLWIDGQHLSAPAEKRVLAQLNTAYDDYYTAAREIEKKVETSSEVAMPGRGVYKTAATGDAACGSGLPIG
jgi:hypothetical protein